MYGSLQEVKEMIEQYVFNRLPDCKVENVIPWTFSAYNNASSAQVANDDSRFFYFGSILIALPAGTASQGTMNFYLPTVGDSELAFSIDSTVRDEWSGKRILHYQFHNVFFQAWSISAVATSSPAAGFYFSGFKIQLVSYCK